MTKTDLSIDYAIGKGVHLLQRDLPGIEFGEYRHWERSRFVAFHSHPGLFQLDYFPDGEGTYRIESEKRAIKSNKLFFVAPGQPHEIKSSAAHPLVNLTIKFRHSCLDHNFLSPLMEIPAPVVGQIERLIREVVSRTVTATADNKYVASLRLAELLVCLYQICQDAHISSRVSPVVQQVIRHMFAHYKEPIALADLARMGNMTAEHLCRVFKKDIGVSPFEFLRLLRLEQAKTLLCEGGRNISEVAAMTGFGKSSDMNRCFQKHLKMNSRAYQKRYSKGKTQLLRCNRRKSTTDTDPDFAESRDR